MIDQVISGIADALYEEFGEGYEIYTENVKQGLKEPCFFITCASPTGGQYLGRRYLREHLFVVQYFPESGIEPKAECMAIQDRLYEALEFITVAGQLKNGTGMEGEVVDEVLHFQVNYKFFMDRVESGDFMETLKQDTEVINW